MSWVRHPSRGRYCVLNRAVQTIDCKLSDSPFGSWVCRSMKVNKHHLQSQFQQLITSRYDRCIRCKLSWNGTCQIVLADAGHVYEYMIKKVLLSKLQRLCDMCVCVCVFVCVCVCVCVCAAGLCHMDWRRSATSWIDCSRTFAPAIKADKE